MGSLPILGLANAYMATPAGGGRAEDGRRKTESINSFEFLVLSVELGDEENAARLRL